MHRFSAIAAPGLEPIVARELSDLGVHPSIQTGVVNFEGDLNRVRLAGQLRCAARLLLQLDQGPARSYEELAARVRRIDWTPYLRPGADIEVSVSSQRSKLRFKDAVEKKVRLAIQDSLRKVRSPRRPQRGRGHESIPQRISARLVDDALTLSIDPGGELLHRRGWRTRSVRAPLRENLAASMLWAAGWAGDEALLDPFCGSGTLPIEAARMAANLPPGTTRRYAFEDWPALSNSRHSHSNRQRSWTPEMPIVGADREPQSLLIAEDNARRANVRLEWQHCDVADLEPPSPLGLVVANPPYGKRLGQHVQGVYSSFGRTLRSQFEGWRAVFLAPEASLARRVHREAELLTQFSNGGLRVGIWVIEST